MSDAKGKGRASTLASDDTSSINGPQSRSPTSVLERVTASATGLAQSAFAAPTSNEISDGASAALSSTGKGYQPGGNSSSSAGNSHTVPQLVPLTSERQSLPSIRAGHREEHMRDTEYEFSSFLDGIDSFTPSSELYSEANQPIAFALGRRPEAGNGEIDAARDKGRRARYYTVDEQQQHDGDAVLSILLQPATSTDETDILPGEETAPNWGLTDQQIAQIRLLVDELFPPPDQQIRTSVENPLNLVPNMIAPATTSDPVSLRASTQEESHLYFGNMPRGEAREMWMEHWEGVLTRYADEVWGNLLPLVEEAREEVKAIRDDHYGTTIAQPNALGRLRQVLDHLRKL